MVSDGTILVQLGKQMQYGAVVFSGKVDWFCAKTSPTIVMITQSTKMGYIASACVLPVLACKCAEPLLTKWIDHAKFECNSEYFRQCFSSYAV